jgi:hypothetical protein
MPPFVTELDVADRRLTDAEASALLSDLVYNVERALEHEIEAQTDP